jgi:tubulin polyglutamylase TTLL4
MVTSPCAFNVVKGVKKLKFPFILPFKLTSSCNREENSSKWSFKTLRKAYEENGINYDFVFAQVKDVILKTLISVEPHIVSNLNKTAGSRNSCFELYGFDILIDEDLKPWLLEVNVLPSLSSSSPFDKIVKTLLICDVLTLVGIRGYDKKKVHGN